MTILSRGEMIAALDSICDDGMGNEMFVPLDPKMRHTAMINGVPIKKFETIKKVLDALKAEQEHLKLAAELHARLIFQQPMEHPAHYTVPFIASPAASNTEVK